MFKIPKRWPAALHVCRIWREILIVNPCYWTDIDANLCLSAAKVTKGASPLRKSAKLALVQIERCLDWAKDEPVDLTLTRVDRFTSSQVMKVFAKKIAKHARNIRTCYEEMDDTESALMNKTLSKMKDSSIRNLTHLRLQIPPNCTWWEIPSLPSVKVLYLEGERPEFPESLLDIDCPNVEALTVKTPYAVDSIPMSDVPNMLSDFPKLKYVHLGFPVFYSDDDPELEELTSIKHVVIGWGFTFEEGIALFLDAIPNIEEISFEYCDRLWGLSQSPLCTQITTLTVFGCNGSSVQEYDVEEWKEVAEALVNLRTLNIGTVEPDWVDEDTSRFIYNEHGIFFHERVLSRFLRVFVSRPEDALLPTVCKKLRHIHIYDNPLSEILLLLLIEILNVRIVIPEIHNDAAERVPKCLISITDSEVVYRTEDKKAEPKCVGFPDIEEVDRDRFIETVIKHFPNVKHLP